MIGIIDADLIDGVTYKFPNLVLMKLSGFYKKTTKTELIMGYNDLFHPLASYDHIFLSKVFTYRRYSFFISIGEKERNDRQTSSL